MGFSNIPNQPIIFEDPIFAGQTCLNNDNRAYAQLLQSGDTMCIQLLNLGDTSTTNILPVTYYGNVLSNGDFSNNLTDWHQGIGGVDDGPWPWGSTFEWYLDSGGAQRISSATKGIFQTLTGATIGDPILISLEFSTYQNIGGIQVNLGDFASTTYNGVNRNATDPVNFDGRFTVILYSYAGLDLFLNGTSGASKPLIKNVKAYNAQIIFVPDSAFLAGWMYVESCNGYQCMATNYAMTSIFTLTPGTAYTFSFEVKNLQGGSIDIYDYDGNLIVSATENRLYEVYQTYTGTSGPITIIVNNNNAINGIIYNFNYGIQCFDHRIKLYNPTTNSESKWFDKTDLDYPIHYYKDRMFWCFRMDHINDSDTGTPLQTGCYYVKIDDCGTGEYSSYTTINYTTGTHDCSVWLEGDNNGYAFDFFFNADDTPYTFKLGQRLRLLQFNPVYVNKSEEYLYSNGNMTRTFAQTSKKREAWFDYVDEPTHDVIRLQLLSDKLTIDNKDYFFVGADYQPEWSQNGKYNLAQSRVELMAVEEKTLFNKSCQ